MITLAKSISYLVNLSIKTVLALEEPKLAEWNQTTCKWDGIWTPKYYTWSTRGNIFLYYVNDIVH